MLTPVPATRATHGPFRRVVAIEDRESSTVYYRTEVLECGHPGKRVWSVHHTLDERASKRRCYACGREEARNAL